MAQEAQRDQNRVPTLIAVSSVDGVTTLTVNADPATHRLYTSGPTGVLPDDARNTAIRDPNRVPALTGISDEDGITPVVIGVDVANNGLFVQET